MKKRGSGTSKDGTVLPANDFDTAEVLVHGGTLSVQSEKGRGSCFTAVIVSPCIKKMALSRPKSEAGQADGEEFACLGGKHVLLCEDHPLNQEIAKALLEDKRMLVQIAEDGQKAVEMFSKSPVDYFDFILMDVRMELFGDKSARLVQFTVSDKLFDLVHGHGVVDPAAGALVLTAAVADPAADGREGIILLYKGKGLFVLAFVCQLQITLDGNVGRAGGLAGGSACVIAVGARIVAVIGIPFFLGPAIVVGELMPATLPSLPTISTGAQR